jgi:hypothetical protein
MFRATGSAPVKTVNGVNGIPEEWNREFPVPDFSEIFFTGTLPVTDEIAIS